MTRSLHLRRVATALLLAAALVASACGNDDESAAAPGSGITVEHRFGTTVVPENPQRIVALDHQWLDVLLALDVQPVGRIAAAVPAGGDTYPWQRDVDPEVPVIDVTDGINYEQIAALQPDLIVVTYLAVEQDTYDALAAIAPTIGLLGDRQVEQWEVIAQVAGRLLDRVDEVRMLVDAVEAEVAAVAAELPGLDGKTFLLVNHVPGDSLWVVADPEDGASTLFAQLGMSIEPDLLAQAAGTAGRIQLSLEQVDQLDSDLLIMLNNGADPNELIGYSQLPSVRSGAALDIDFASVTGLNTPSPLSVPYSLGVIRAALVAAAAS